MTVAEDLADWTSALRPQDLSDPVRTAAKRHVLDAFGTALAASRTGVVDPAVEVAVGLGGPPEANVLGSPDRVGAPAAALGTGALVHGLDFDDTHAEGLVHASAVVLPAALAVGQQVGASGAEVLTAAVAGYEVACRVAMASPHGFHARGLHATAISGVFSATAVAARLTGLDAATTAQAFGIAGSSAGGLLEFLSTGSSTKQLHPGAASMNGILAARLAAAGATGPVSVFEGERGLFAALSARDADPAAIVDGLGRDWEVRRITIKPYPACQLMHATLDAAAEAMHQDLDVDAIDEVVAVVHPDAVPIVCDPAGAKVTPRTSYEAKFSLQWSVAALLLDGRVDLATYDTASLADPGRAALARRVRVVTAGGGTAADAPGQVDIQLYGGRTVTGEVPCSHGGPSLPLPEEALVAKFVGNAGRSESSQEIARRVLALDDETDLDQLMKITASTGEPT